MTLPPRGDDPPIPPAPPAGGNTAAIETSGLAKKYRRVTALSDCTISVPAGRISALVGPNGAGKTTLLRLLTGLAAPTAGRATVLGATPRQDPGYLAEIGFLAQEIPLYRRLTAQDHIGIGTHLNPRWDGDSVRARLGGLRIPLDQRVGTLSGGQRAQVALALTLAKRPRVLLLDEPLAALDPLARQNFLAALAEAAVGGELTIVLSSHLIADIERICDHLILLADSRVQLCGDIDALLAEHRVLVGPRKDTTAIARAHTIVREDSTARQTTLLVRLNGPVIDPAWAVEETNLEEMVLGYMTQGGAGAGTGPAARLSAVGRDR
jgi:ABC-2 type transport system ATP-binding protein